MDHTGLINKTQAAKKSKRGCLRDQETALRKARILPQRKDIPLLSQIKRVTSQQVHIKLLILACSSN